MGTPQQVAAKLQAFGDAGIVGEGEIHDFTAIGDVMNTASRLQGVAMGRETVMSDAVARLDSVTGGEVITLDLKGKAEPVIARRITLASWAGDARVCQHGHPGPSPDRWNGRS